MPGKKFSVKVHQIYRLIVAVCDLELLGKKFEQDNLQLEVNEKFYKDKELDETALLKLLKRSQQDDACFNFVGKNSIDIASNLGLVDKNCVIEIQGIPHAMALV